MPSLCSTCYAAPSNRHCSTRKQMCSKTTGKRSQAACTKTCQLGNDPKQPKTCQLGNDPKQRATKHANKTLHTKCYNNKTLLQLVFSSLPGYGPRGGHAPKGAQEGRTQPQKGSTGLSLLEVATASGRESGNVAGHKPDPRPHSGKVEHAIQMHVNKSSGNIQ